MRSRLQLAALALLLTIPSLAASFRSPNFVVQAPTPQLAQQAAQFAEHYRRDKAMLWLGREMPPWHEPCPIVIKITGGGSGGATSFAFDQGTILGQEMEVEGKADRILASVLPHEITHTVLAHYFRTPVPRWADEGASVMSEDEPERQLHDRMAREILMNPYRRIPLRHLFSMKKYPHDVMVLYALGYSVTDFLVNRGGRANFLSFIALGMRGDWDTAVRVHYGFDRVENLEAAWIDYMRSTQPQQPNPQNLARNGVPPQGNTPASLTSSPQNSMVQGGGQGVMDSRGMVVPNWNREAPPPIYLSAQNAGPAYQPNTPYPQPIYQNSQGYPENRGVTLGQPTPAPAMAMSEYPHPPIRMVAQPPHPSMYQNQDWVGAPIPPPPPGAPAFQTASVLVMPRTNTPGVWSNPAATPSQPNGNPQPTSTPQGYPAAPPPIYATGPVVTQPEPVQAVRLGAPTPTP